MLLPGGEILKLCAGQLHCAFFFYIAMINDWENVHTLGAHVRFTCARLWKCVHQAQGTTPVP